MESAMKNTIQANEKGLKVLRYASLSCVLLCVCFLAYAYLYAFQNSINVSGLILNNLYITVGYIVCTANIIAWSILSRVRKSLEQNGAEEASKKKLLIVAISEIMLMNFLTSGLIFASIFMIFPLKGKKTKLDSVRPIVSCSIPMGICVLLSYIIVFEGLLK